MKKPPVFILILISLVVNGCSQNKAIDQKGNDLVLVKGGKFINQKSNLYGKKIILPDFYIGKNEVTQKEWVEVMGNNPSKFKGDDLPVEMVDWYSCIEYCTKRSLKEGLKPYYNIDKHKKDEDNISKYDSIKWTVTINAGANGYRLPSEAEWEYAAGGGQKSKSYTFSGSNDIKEVAWYWRNCGDSVLVGEWSYPALEQNHCKTRQVRGKKPNELGLYDMTGNVREWCEDWYQDPNVRMGMYRSQRGGGWIGIEKFSKLSDRDNFEASGVGPDQGFRICKNK